MMHSAASARELLVPRASVCIPKIRLRSLCRCTATRTALLAPQAFC